MSSGKETCEENIEPSPESTLPLQEVAANSTEGSISYYEAVPDQGICYLPETNCSDMYMGFNETYPEYEDQGVYCMPRYISYAPSEASSHDNQSLAHHPYLSTSGYLQHSYIYGSDQVPVYNWDSEQGAGYPQLVPSIHNNATFGGSSTEPTPSNPEEPNLVETKNTAEVKISSEPLDLRSQPTAENSNLVSRKAFSRSSNSRSYPNVEDSSFLRKKITAEVKASSGRLNLKSDQTAYPLKSSVEHANSLYKSIRPFSGSSSIQTSLYAATQYKRSTKMASSSYQGQYGYSPRNNIQVNRSTSPAIINNNSRMKEKSSLHTRYGDSSELIIGPRADREMSPSSSSLRNELSPFLCRDHFNKPDFETTYEQAKFFMIKSYSEDDIHKSVKYSVWSSTPNGNNKLDAAFLDAERATLEKGSKCPVFLFFSVNASGQFVGLAEMTGPVDFKKKMDFWQQDKWNGFFPVTWHIIKDIPNKNFQHITLENNDNKPVPFSRDTQEIYLPQGLQMLHMFKSYQPRRSILDDFDFYENREKSVHNTKLSRSNNSMFTSTDADFKDYTSVRHLERAVGEMNISGSARDCSGPSSTPYNFPRNPLRSYHQQMNRS